MPGFFEKAEISRTGRVGGGKYTNLKIALITSDHYTYVHNSHLATSRNDANCIIRKCFIFLFGGTIWELGIVIYSKSCYVSPHMSEMEIKDPKNTRICKPSNSILISCRIALFSCILEDFENASPYFCTFLANRVCD